MCNTKWTTHAHMHAHTNAYMHITLLRRRSVIRGEVNMEGVGAGRRDR